MLVGLGIDLEEIERFRVVLKKRKRLIPQVFTQKEQDLAAQLADPAVMLTAAFAVKEAVMKAMGKTWTDSGVFWTDIELSTPPDHPMPQLTLSGETQKCQAALGSDRARVQLSIHEPFILAQIWLLGPN